METGTLALDSLLHKRWLHTGTFLQSASTGYPQSVYAFSKVMSLSTTVIIANVAMD